MNHNIPAALVFRVLAVVAGVAGASLLVLAVLTIQGTHALGVGAVVIGALMVTAGVMGPLRIVLSGHILLPAEIKRTLTITGYCVPLAGAGLIAGGAANTSVVAGGGLFLCCGALWILGNVGFYRMSRSFPNGFSAGELVKIIRSTGMIGSTGSDVPPSTQAFERWTNGRAGVAVGSAAPNGEVFSLEGAPQRLSELFGDDRAVVLNLGSYTCPHHRKRIDELRRLVDRWGEKDISFVTVYIAEAHPEDGWKLEGQYTGDEEYTGVPKDFLFFYAKSLEDRIKMAKRLVEKKVFPMPVFVDGIEDGVMRLYNAWPIRLYVIQNGQIVYMGGQGPFGYEPSQVDALLRTLVG